MRTSLRMLGLVAALVVVSSSDVGAVQRLGTTGDDVIAGSPNADYLGSEDGFDALFGRGGNDVLDGGADNDRLHPGGGVDLVLGHGDWDLFIDDDSSFDRLVSGDGNAGVMAADGVKTRIECGPGNDVVFTDSPRIDVLVGTCEVIVRATSTTNRFGTNRNDTINGDAAFNRLIGKLGDDTLNARGGQDEIFLGAGQDIGNGGGGVDTIIDDDSEPGDRLNGGPDQDLLFSVDGGADRIDCGRGDGVIDNVFADRTDVLRNCAGSDVVVRL